MKFASKKKVANRTVGLPFVHIVQSLPKGGLGRKCRYMGANTHKRKKQPIGLLI